MAFALVAESDGEHHVKGDRAFEWQEVFYVNLSAASGGFVASSQGTGVIRNDDR